MILMEGLMIEDGKAYEISAEFINGRLMELMENVFAQVDGEPESNLTNPKLTMLIKDYFPEGYDESVMNFWFIGLYGLLKEEKMYAPKLIMEYVLAALIDEACEDEENAVQEVPERDYILDKLKEQESEDGEAEYMLNVIEDMREYLEICFPDSDYLLLDNYDEDDLAKSYLNKMMGITEGSGFKFVFNPNDFT